MKRKPTDQEKTFGNNNQQGINIQNTWTAQTTQYCKNIQTNQKIGRIPKSMFL